MPFAIASPIPMGTTPGVKVMGPEFCPSHYPRETDIPHKVCTQILKAPLITTAKNSKQLS